MREVKEIVFCRGPRPDMVMLVLVRMEDGRLAEETCWVLGLWEDIDELTEEGSNAGVNGGEDIRSSRDLRCSVWRWGGESSTRGRESSEEVEDVEGRKDEAR